MKRFYLLIFATIIFGSALAQKTSLDPVISPAFFQPNTEITVTYDVTGTSLANLANAYIWVWIPGKNIDAKYNVNPASNNATATNNAKFTKTVANGKTTFSITFKPADFFSTSIAGETELGMLLKGNDWSNGQTTDYVAPFSSGEFAIKVNSPTQQPLFVSNGAQIQISAETPENANYKLYIDDVLKTEQNNVLTFTYTHTVTETSGGAVVKITATAGSKSAETTFSYLISTTSPTVARPQGIIEGINYSSDHTKATVCVLAPGKTSVYVRGDFSDWDVLPEYLMKRDGEHFWLEITGLTAGQEYGFQYLLDQTVYIADPYADKILDPDDQYIPAAVYPNLKQYPEKARSNKWYFNRVAVLQTNQTKYNWQVPNFQKPKKESLVIYELLIRDFFGHQDRSYKNLTDTISYLKGLGVNAIELMPIMEFNGNDSWGYNPTFMFAPDKYYGPKNELKRFIDECHKAGIAVILDIAMNHQDMPNPFLFTDFNFTTEQANPTNKWFNVSATHPYSVFKDMNHESSYTKAYLDTVNHYWLNEYKMDGFRFDLSKGFTQKNTGEEATPSNVNAWGKYDASRIAILKRMADVIWSHSPDAYVILEHLSENDEEKELAEYRANEGKGMMLWGNMNGAYNQLTMGYATNSDISWTYYSRRGWTVPHLVSYMESHDEERLAYRNKQFGAAAGSYSAKNHTTSMARIGATSVIFYSIPGPKMLWQFGEVGYDYSINHCPDGSINENCRVSAKPVQWEYLNDPDRSKLRRLTSDLAALHTTYSVFADGTATVTEGSASLIKQVTVKNNPYTATPTNANQMNVQAVANLELSEKKVMVSFPHTGTWYDYYDGGRAINVTTTPMEVTLPRGGYKLYTDVAIGPGPITAAGNRVVENSFYGVPNPTTGVFRIAGELANQNFTLLDIHGNSYTVKKDGDYFDISHLAPGMYVLVAQDRSGRKKFTKLIKQ